MKNKKNTVYTFRKADILIPIIGAAAAVIIYLLPVYGSRERGREAVVTVDGEIFGVYPLENDADILIPGAANLNNRLVIKDGEADIIEAGCPDKTCVRMRKIKYKGETLVCLPNKVVVEIKGEGEDDFDAVAR